MLKTINGVKVDIRVKKITWMGVIESSIRFTLPTGEELTRHEADTLFGWDAVNSALGRMGE